MSKTCRFPTLLNKRWRIAWAVLCCTSSAVTKGVPLRNKATVLKCAKTSHRRPLHQRFFDNNAVRTRKHAEYYCSCCHKECASHLCRTNRERTKYTLKNKASNTRYLARKGRECKLKSRLEKCAWVFQYPGIKTLSTKIPVVLEQKAREMERSQEREGKIFLWIYKFLVTLMTDLLVLKC